MSKYKINDIVVPWRNQCRESGRKVVMTSGCFDILHPGHIQFLQDAKAIGDELIVSVAMTTSHKGKGRPFYTCMDRCLMVAALECVDVVTTHQTDKLIYRIRELHPDIYVKGGDYGGQQLPEAEEVQKGGGVVAILPLYGKYSTSDLIERIKRDA